MFDTAIIEKRLAKAQFNNYHVPSADQLSELVLDGRSRILKAASKPGLCVLSERYFEFCWTQVAQFNAGNYNAVEIAYFCGLQPIHVAAAIHEFGSDWGVKLLQRKGLTKMIRGQHTVHHSGQIFWAHSCIKSRLIPAHLLVTSKQRALFHLVSRDDYAASQAMIANTVTLAVGIISTRRPVFNDPRIKKGHPVLNAADKNTIKSKVRDALGDRAGVPFNAYVPEEERGPTVGQTLGYSWPSAQH